MAVGILFECRQTGGFGIRKAPRQTLSLAFITLSLGSYSFYLEVKETGQALTGHRTQIRGGSWTHSRDIDQTGRERDQRRERIEPNWTDWTARNTMQAGPDGPDRIRRERRETSKNP